MLPSQRHRSAPGSHSRQHGPFAGQYDDGWILAELVGWARVRCVPGRCGCIRRAGSYSAGADQKRRHRTWRPEDRMGALLGVPQRRSGRSAQL